MESSGCLALEWAQKSLWPWPCSLRARDCASGKGCAHTGKRSGARLSWAGSHTKRKRQEQVSFMSRRPAPSSGSSSEPACGRHFMNTLITLPLRVRRQKRPSVWVLFCQSIHFQSHLPGTPTAAGSGGKGWSTVQGRALAQLKGPPERWSLRRDAARSAYARWRWRRRSGTWVRRLGSVDPHCDP